MIIKVESHKIKRYTSGIILITFNLNVRGFSCDRLGDTRYRFEHWIEEDETEEIDYEIEDINKDAVHYFVTSAIEKDQAYFMYTPFKLLDKNK